MANTPKAEWEPCVVCGDLNGPIPRRYSTPARISVAGYSVELKAEGCAVTVGDMCEKCRRRMAARRLYEKRKSLGQRGNARPVKDWTP